MLCLRLCWMEDASPPGHSMSGIGTSIHPCPRVEEYLQKSNVLLDLVFRDNQQTHAYVNQGIERRHSKQRSLPQTGKRTSSLTSAPRGVLPLRRQWRKRYRQFFASNSVDLKMKPQQGLADALGSWENEWHSCELCP